MSENQVSDDNLGSCGSVDDAHTPDDDTESLNQSISSPGGLSGLSSLQSPSTSLASPINLLASPSTPSINHHHEESGLVASLVNQLQRNKMKNDEKMQIKTEPMDQSNGSYQRPPNFDFLYDKLPIIRNPVGANPRDINNPLSVNQLTKRDFPQPTAAGYYSHPFQKPIMAHPLAHPAAHHSLAAQFHAASFANLQLAAAAAAQNVGQVGHHQHKEGSGSGPHRDDTGNAISVT